MTKKYWLDFAERLGWTVAEVVVAALIVALGDFDAVWVPILTTGLMIVKGFIAKHVGDPESAGTV